MFRGDVLHSAEAIVHVNGEGKYRGGGRSASRRDERWFVVTVRSAETGSVSRRSIVYGLVGGGAIGALAAPSGAQAAGALTDDRRPWVERAEMPVNVKDYGATGDGETDDTEAIQAAVTAAAESGRSVYLPAGSYVSTAAIRAKGALHLIGDGMWLTTVTLTADSGFVDPGTHAASMAVEDIAFDSTGRQRSAFEIDGGAIPSFAFRRCRFVNLAGPNQAPAACEVLSLGDGVFVDCLWHNPAAYAGQGTAIRVERATSGNRLRVLGDNRFLWLNNGIRTNRGKPVGVGARIESVEIDGAYFDGFWWLMPATHAGEGSRVTYTDTSLSHAGADLGDVPAGAYPSTANVRAMPVRASGTVGSATGTRLVDPDADFIAAGTKRGEIVRSNGRFGVVVGAVGEDKSDTVQVEEWLDDESLLPTNPPAEGAEYTLYGVLISYATQASTTTLTMGVPWRDLYGNLVVPPAGTRYEVLPPVLRYLVNCDKETQNLTVTNSTFRRGWADGIGGYAQRITLIGNLFEDGQDYGCTIEGGRTGHVVMGNTFRHNATAGLYFHGDESVVTGNHGEGNCWFREGTSQSQAADFTIRHASRSYIAHNSGQAGPESANPAACVVLWTDASENVAEHNRRYGNPDEPDVTVSGSRVIDNEIIGARSIRYAMGATGQLVETSGPGTPEGVLTAAPGSTYRRTDGGAGATLYVKESGSDATGWVAK